MQVSRCHLGLRAAALLLSVVPIAFAQSSGYWHTSGNQIQDSGGKTVRMSGVNWYGFETTDEVVHGLWAQDYKAILDAVKANGYNVVRIPFSNQMVESPIVPGNINYSNGKNSDLGGLNSLQILDKVVAYAGQIGLRIVLDNHRSEAGNSAEANGLWYTSAYPESAWINDWKTLASRYLNNTTVVGMDLRNEPHNAYSGGACWGCGGANDWRLAAQRAGNAVLAINSKLLIFVEGVDAFNNDYYWWGGNLEGVQQYPVTLNTANQLVYSAHDYGPHEYGQGWFNGSTSQASLNSVWNTHWGYISQNKIAPVWLGEFGTTNTASDIQNSAAGSQGQWFQSLINYLSANPQVSWTYWALNGEDSYGLLDGNYDPTPANAQKQQLLASVQGASTGGGGGGPTTPAAPGNLNAAAATSAEIDLTWNASSTGGVTYNVYSSNNANVIVTPSARIASGVTATSFKETGLSASTTYYYVVTAVNSAGESGPSNTASAKTQNSGGGGSGNACHVSYSVPGDWGVGFTANLAITNTGSSTITAWKLTWVWPGNQQITQSWNGTFAQSGPNASLTNMSYNGTIAPGGQAQGIGFNGSYSGKNTAPAAFYLNGTLCQ